MKAFRSFILISILCFTTSHRAVADEVYTFVVKKQEEKAKNRWSLEDWLETRDRIRLMDLWLALHSPSPYEFFIGGDYVIGTEGPRGRYGSWRLNGAAYASIFGLGLSYDASDPDAFWQALFHLRIFGFHAQGTNITLHLGLKNQTGASSYRNPVAGVDLTLYLARFFGLQGLWHHFFPSTPGSNGEKVNSDRFEGGAFIDFKFLRLQGTYFHQTETTVAGGVSTDVPRAGIILGGKFFF